MRTICQTPRCVPRSLLLLSLATVFLGTAAVDSLRAQDPDLDPLATYRGSRLLVEFPSLDDIGRKIDVPDGWKFLQVTAENYDQLIHHLDAGRSPEAFLYFDEYGNFAHREQNRDRLGRLERGYTEAEKKIASWKRHLKKDTNLLLDARRQRRDERELDLLIGIRDSKLEGYPEVVAAHVRLAELEEIRLAELWGILATEGLVRRRALASALSELHDRSEGLAIAATIEIEFDRIDAGHVTHEKRPRSTG